jgi:putative DNA methylase
VALTTFSDLIQEVRVRVKNDAIVAGMSDDGRPLSTRGDGAAAYADAISVLAALSLDKFAGFNNTICTWNPTNQNIGHMFTKQAIPMAWDFPETSPLSGGLSFERITEGIARTIAFLPANKHESGISAGLRSLRLEQEGTIVSTDPPYYDNIGYADLSDFFYVWLRRSLKSIFPDLFTTLVEPKTEELVATPYRATVVKRKRRRSFSTA